MRESTHGSNARNLRLHVVLVIDTTRTATVDRTTLNALYVWLRAEALSTIAPRMWSVRARTSTT